MTAIIDTLEEDIRSLEKRIKKLYKDGFQFSDLNTVITEIIPDIYTLYLQVEGQVKGEDPKAFIKDCLYRILDILEDKDIFKLSGFWGWILRTIVLPIVVNAAVDRFLSRNTD